MSDQSSGVAAPADKRTPTELYRDWQRLVRTLRSADAKMLDLIRHPEATDEQILTVVRESRKVFQLLKQMREGLQKLLRASGKWELAERVDEDMKRLRSPEMPPLPSNYKKGPGF